MKVDNIVQKEISVIRNEATEKKSRAVDCREFAVPSANDRVSISSLINYLNHSVTSNKADQARSDRVTALKSLIETGNYNVRGQKVAAKMLSMAQE
jgi:flagellar biosynthesis anti-sigma factor FlgM